MSDRYSSQMARAAILVQQGDHAAAADYFTQAVVSARAEFGEHDKRLASALEGLSDALRKLGRLVDAERHMHEAVLIRLKNMRRDGKALHQAQKYQEAERLYREALEACLRAFGERHRETATCRDNLATNLRLQGRYQEAVTFALEASEIREEVLGRNHHHTAQSYSNVGLLFRILGRYDEALTLLIRSLVGREKILGPNHLAVAESCDRLAMTYRDLGRFDDAEKHCRRALQLREQTIGHDHPLTGASKNQLALIMERRSDGPVGTIDDVVAAPEPALPKVVVAATPTRDKESHAAGYTILGALLIGGGASAALAWYVPYFGVVAGIAVLVFVVATLLLPMSFKTLAMRGMARFRRAMAEPEELDRGAIVLGRAPTAGEIGAASRSSTLTADDVRELPNRDVLDLHWVKEMTLEAAEELKDRRCCLQLNALTALPSKLARPLRKHRGSLQLNAITSLTTPAAAHIGWHEGPMLQLNGLRELSAGVAEHLANHRGDLHLDGLRSMDEEAARRLSENKKRGRLTLHGLQLASRQTVRLLRSSPLIELPESLGDGI